MHAAIKAGPVAIYARFSSTLQNERSVDDQVRRCREFVAQQGGNAEAAKVFADFAISGASLDRPGFEAMMSAVDKKAIKVIVTEDMSRMSRDFADSAHIFKRLQFLQVPLVGVADGIDTSQKHSKLSFAVKSLVADIYLDDLRDKTLRGLESRALQGFATGNVAYGYHTVPATDDRGGVIGNRIEIHDGEAGTVRRIFEMCRDGQSLATIARTLNQEHIPSPRVGQRHTCVGWGSSTIRAMVRNERYVGVWRFKERQWVKVPGENRRQPRARNAADVMVTQRPELRIIDEALWTEVQARLATVAKRYQRGGTERGVPRKSTVYLLSSLLVCGQCGAPMSISTGTSASYYRCQVHRTKGTCPNRVSVREDVARARILGAIQAHMLSPDGVAHLRRRIAEELADHGRKVEAEYKERQDRLARTQQKIRGLVEFIALGDRSETVVSTLHDLEAYARAEKAELRQLAAEVDKPIRLPSLDEVTVLATDLGARLGDDVEIGREMLRRWLHEGTIRIDPSDEGPVATTSLLPMRVLLDSSGRSRRDHGGRKDGRKRKITEDSVLSDLQLLTRRSGGRI
jgi:site-specific DNA recombinase